MALLVVSAGGAPAVGAAMHLHCPVPRYVHGMTRNSYYFKYVYSCNSRDLARLQLCTSVLSIVGLVY